MNAVFAKLQKYFSGSNFKRLSVDPELCWKPSPRVSAAGGGSRTPAASRTEVAMPVPARTVPLVPGRDGQRGRTHKNTSNNQ